MPNQPLSEWDRTTGAQLRRIETAAQLIQNYTKIVVEAAERLKYLPDWESRAESELQKALIEISASQLGLAVALRSMQNLKEPKDGDDLQEGPDGATLGQVQPGAESASGRVLPKQK